MAKQKNKQFHKAGFRDPSNEINISLTGGQRGDKTIYTSKKKKERSLGRPEHCLLRQNN